MGGTVGVTVTASNSRGSDRARSDQSVTIQSPGAPPAEPSTERDDLDDATATSEGSWLALDEAAAQAYEAGRLTLPNAIALSATNGRPPYHCNASMSKKVGGVREIHTEGGGTEKMRTIRWAYKETCTGGQQVIHLKGHSFLNRLGSDKSFHLYSIGKSYDTTPSGPVMQVRVGDATIEGQKRGIKQVEWHAVSEVPAPYQWINDEPFGHLSGVNDDKTHCSRYPNSTSPRYLGILSCVIYGHQFR
ncbi:MAG TPA: hypothetical protein VF545_10415 [Thermoleophilaceae bacterium]